MDRVSYLAPDGLRTDDVRAPFVLLGMLAIAADNTIMFRQSSSRLSIVVVAFTTAFMFAAAIGMSFLWEISVAVDGCVSHESL